MCPYTNNEEEDGQWIMDDELSLPMGKFVFLACFMYKTCNN